MAYRICISFFWTTSFILHGFTYLVCDTRITRCNFRLNSTEEKLFEWTSRLFTFQRFNWTYFLFLLFFWTNKKFNICLRGGSNLFLWRQKGYTMICTKEEKNKTNKITKIINTTMHVVMFDYNIVIVHIYLCLL